MLGDISACGSFQMNHMWMEILKSLPAKQKLVSAGAFGVKEKRCLVIGSDKTDMRVELFWIHLHVPDDTMRKALEPYGKIEKVTRETWRVSGLEGAQSTTREARLTLKEGATVEQPPQQIRLPGCTVLVLPSGRASFCLRCRRTGHIRKEWRVPRCDGCRRFGHTNKDCEKTYVAIFKTRTVDEVSELVMDQKGS